MTKKCSKCGETIGEESLFCPKCGSYIMSAGSKKSYPIKWIAITGICIVLLLFAGAFFINHSSKTDTTLSMISNSNLDASNEYTVQLKDVNNRVLADKFITVKFNNESYTLVTDKNGTASINLTVIKGSFEVKSYFKGDSKYNDAHSSDIVIK